MDFLFRCLERQRAAGITHDAIELDGAPLYSDALSMPDGPAPTYIQMIEYNTAALKKGMLKN